MIRKEIGIFLIVGSLTVFVDSLTYSCLLWTALFSVEFAKAIGFLMGTIFAYFANRMWTFGHKKPIEGSVFRFVILYIATLCTNVLINSFILKVFAGMSNVLQIAFLTATAVSAILNFLGMKLFAFKERAAI